MENTALYNCAVAPRHFAYISNPKNRINKWFAIAAFLCWLGAAKEATLFNIIPFLETARGVSDLADRFLPLYSVLTWALYSLAMPAMIIFAVTWRCFTRKPYA